MTLNKFPSGFDQTQAFKSFGAEISARVENGREALGIAAASQTRKQTMEGFGNG